MSRWATICAVPGSCAVKLIGGSVQFVPGARQAITIGATPGCRTAGSLDFGWAGYGNISAITCCPGATWTVVPLAAGVTTAGSRTVLGGGEDRTEGFGAVAVVGTPGGPGGAGGRGEDGTDLLLGGAGLRFVADEGVPGPVMAGELSEKPVDALATGAGPDPGAASRVELADTVPGAPGEEAAAFPRSAVEEQETVVKPTRTAHSAVTPTQCPRARIADLLDPTVPRADSPTVLRSGPAEQTIRRRRKSVPGDGLGRPAISRHVRFYPVG